MAVQDDILTTWYEVWYVTGTAARCENTRMATVDDAWGNFAQFAVVYGWDSGFVVKNTLTDGALTREFVPQPT